MKIVFYIKNERPQSLYEVGIYTLPSTYQYQSDKLEQQMKSILGVSKAYVNGKNITNANLRAFDAIYQVIDQQMSIQQFKCIGYHPKQDVLFYLVQIKGAKINQSFRGLEQLSNQDSLYQQTQKVVKQYRKKLEKSKRGAVRSAWKAENTIKYYIDRSLDIVALCLSFSIAIAKDHLLPIIFWLSIAVLVVGILRWGITCIEKRQAFQKMCKQVTLVEGKPKEEIIQTALQPTAKYEDFDSMDFKYANQETEIFLYSPQANQHLAMNASKIVVEYQKSKQTLSKDSRRALACIISDKLSHDKSIFNGKLIGIDTDLCFNNIDKVVIKPVGYYAYVSTDEMIFRNMMISSDPNYYLAGHRLSLNPVTGKLKDIEHSSLTNLIGINLIVEIIVHKQHYLILQQQSMYNDVNGNRFVPSASGSLDRKDYKSFQNDKDKNFQTLLEYGMYRELQEECYVDVKQYTDTHFQLLGCARLMSKAGKPDFFAKLEIKVQHEDEIQKMLTIYDLCQNGNIGIQNQERKSNKRVIVDHEDEIQKMIAIYDSYQKNQMGRKNKELESNKMVIVDKDSFLATTNFDASLSPQLRYGENLLQEESKKA